MSVSNLYFAQLGIRSGEFWLSKYPNFKTNFIMADDYLSFHQNFRVLITTQSNKNSERRQITNELSSINTKIDTSIKFIKNYLAELYGSNSKLYYTLYGLVLENNKYTIPKDNNKRMLALDILVKTLQDNNNIWDAQKYGSLYWVDIQHRHRVIWAATKTLDGTISMNSANLKQMKTQSILLQKRLRAQIRIDFPSNYKGIIRDFGFQD